MSKPATYAVGKSPEAVNASMIKFLPELDSDYARFPMHHPRWYQPREKGPKGESCFVKADADAGVRKDYAYCKAGPFGPGYYLLMCKVSYINLYTKLGSLEPGTCGCACNAADRVAMDEFDDVRRVLHGRQCSPSPDDAAAAASSIQEGKSWADASYNADNAVGFVTGVNGL
jgi:hypothetical protein